MSDSQQDQMQPVEEFTKVESIFVRHRNTLMLRAQFTPIYTDYYLLLMENNLRFKEDLDNKMKDLLAAITLHAVARPWAETIAWTVNLRAPRVNFFASAGSTQENVIGTLFTENVKENDRSLLFNQTMHSEKGMSRSTVEIDSSDPSEWIEKYYAQSEQRPGRFFRLPNETFVLLAAQPDFDEEWFNELTVDDVAKICEKEETKLLETRRFKFHCGCSKERLIQSLLHYKGNLDELFQGDDTLTATCPRCQTSYTFDRDSFEEFDTPQKPGSEPDTESNED